MGQSIVCINIENITFEKVVLEPTLDIIHGLL